MSKGQRGRKKLQKGIFPLEIQSVGGGRTGCGGRIQPQTTRRRRCCWTRSASFSSLHQAPPSPSLSSPPYLSPLSLGSLAFIVAADEGKAIILFLSTNCPLRYTFFPVINSTFLTAQIQEAFVKKEERSIFAKLVFDRQQNVHLLLCSWTLPGKRPVHLVNLVLNI